VGLGPVFAFELRTASRRWWVYAALSILVGLVLGALVAASTGSLPSTMFGRTSTFTRRPAESTGKNTTRRLSRSRR
jgi:hypothetical protein